MKVILETDIQVRGASTKWFGFRLRV